jgi:hypothetical protein
MEAGRRGGERSECSECSRRGSRAAGNRSRGPAGTLRRMGLQAGCVPSVAGCIAQGCRRDRVGLQAGHIGLQAGHLVSRSSGCGLRSAIEKTVSEATQRSGSLVGVRG